jgi:hypothetical protein
LDAINEDLKNWGMKLFVVDRVEKWLSHRQTAETRISENKFSEALKLTSKIWKLIKENGKKNEAKKKYGNMISKAQ